VFTVHVRRLVLYKIFSKWLFCNTKNTHRQGGSYSLWSPLENQEGTIGQDFGWAMTINVRILSLSNPSRSILDIVFTVCGVCSSYIFLTMHLLTINHHGKRWHLIWDGPLNGFFFIATGGGRVIKVHKA
jgi:hypothetical protein